MRYSASIGLEDVRMGKLLTILRGSGPETVTNGIAKMANSFSGPKPLAQSMTHLPVLSSNSAINVGFGLTVAWVFIEFSRFFDFVAAGYKIPGIIYYAMIAFILLSGAIPLTLSNRITQIIVAFTVWVGVTLPFSTWRSNSLESGRESFQCLMTFVAVSGLVISGRQCIRIIQTLGWASFVGAALSFRYGSMETGRLELFQGSFKDPNEYAMTLLMGLPLLALSVRADSLFLRIAGGVGTLLTFYVFLRTGSRGGMIALLAMGLVLFWGVSLSKKVVVLVAAGAALAIGFAVLPNYIQARYGTFFAADESGPMSEEERAMLQGADVDSTEGRLGVLYDGLRLTAKHPLFGVGPGNFAVARWSEGAAEGKRVGWNVTHNTYVQLSSEIGIPGALLFIAFLYRAFQATRRVVKNGAVNGYPELARAAYHLQLSFVALCVAAFFLSLGYFPAFYVLGAIALSLERAICQPRLSGSLAQVRVAGLPVGAPVAFASPAPSTKKALSGKEIRALMRTLPGARFGVPVSSADPPRFRSGPGRGPLPSGGQPAPKSTQGPPQL
jgi:O-antigen ligase